MNPSISASLALAQGWDGSYRYFSPPWVCGVRVFKPISKKQKRLRRMRRKSQQINRRKRK